MVRILIPDLSAFIKFNDLDPGRQDQCIYITQKGKRCRWQCSNIDNSQAIKLHLIITKCQGKDIDLNVLEKYILSNCCTSARAQHQSRIEDVGLLALLAQRWRDEISAQSRDRFELVSAISKTYELMAQTPLSEFRRHVVQPTSSDSVACRIRNRLEDRDFEIGSLYIFDRASSPGYVKIGWTARSVKGRLEAWSKCGYIPNLLFEVQDVPLAQRVETLTHYELIKEWRRERMCKADSCRKSHCEWFETSAERAIEVVNDWATFIKVAKPYDLQGSLQPYWKNILGRMDEDGERISGHSLLQRHLIREPKDLVRVRRLVDPRCLIKSEDQDMIRSSSNKDDREMPDEHWTHTYPMSIKQQPSSKAPVFVSRSLPQPISPVKVRLPTALKRPKSKSSLKAESTPGTESSSNPDTTRKTWLALTTKP